MIFQKKPRFQSVTLLGLNAKLEVIIMILHLGLRCLFLIIIIIFLYKMRYILWIFKKKNKQTSKKAKYESSTD